MAIGDGSLWSLRDRSRPREAPPSDARLIEPKRTLPRACHALSDFLFSASVVVSAVGLFGVVIWGVGGFLAELVRIMGEWIGHAAS